MMNELVLGTALAQTPESGTEPVSRAEQLASTAMIQTMDHLAAMENIVQTLALTVTIISVILALSGAVFVVLEYWSRRNLRTDLIERMQEFERRFEDLSRTRFDLESSQLKQTIVKEVERVGDERLTRELDARMARIETSYAKSFAQIERVMRCFQSDCQVREGNGACSYDFIRYENVRILLTHLLSGDRKDIHAALSGLLREQTRGFGYLTSYHLAELIEQLRSARFQGRELSQLADQLREQLPPIWRPEAAAAD